SIASMVFSKVAGSGLSAILRISARCCCMPSSKAGMKSLSWILSNGGAWNGRVLAVSRGFSAAGVTSAGASVFGSAVVMESGAWPLLQAASARLTAAARTSGRIMEGLLQGPARGRKPHRVTPAWPHRHVQLVHPAHSGSEAVPRDPARQEGSGIPRTAPAASFRGPGSPPAGQARLLHHVHLDLARIGAAMVVDDRDAQARGLRRRPRDRLAGGR